MPTNTQNKNPLFYSPIVTILAIGVLGFIFYGIIKDRPKTIDVKNQISNIKSEIDKFESQSNQTSQLLDYFKTQDYLEKEARIKLNLKKVGEEVVLIQKTEQNEESNTEEQVKKDSGFFKKAGEWIVNLFKREL